LNKQAQHYLSIEMHQKATDTLSEAFKLLNHSPLPTKAIICYNLACVYQMQTDLARCSQYLVQAIKHTESLLNQLKEKA